MRSKILAPLAVLALALTTGGTAAAQDQAPPPATAQASASFSTSDMAAPSSSDGDVKKTVLPWVFGGLGAAQLITGVVLVIAAPEMPSNCTEGTRTCTRQPGQSEASFKENQEQAGEAQLMPALGGIAIASGAVFLATGLAMHFWYNRSDAKTASRKPVIVPYAGATGGGLAAVATF
jgi:hypothetical protein